MEKKFLLYILYVALIEIRERSYEANDNKTFWICDLLHNIPLSLSHDEIDAKDTYKHVFESFESMGLSNWLKLREEEFNARNPDYIKDDKS